MELKKEKLMWTENVAIKTSQIEADLDVIVPDSKPDIKKILQIDADVVPTTCDVQNDRILLCGNVFFNIIYLPEDNQMLQSIKVMAPITDIVTVSGANPKMDCTFDAEVLSVNYKILNGRKFSVKCEVEGKVNVKNSADIETVTMIDDSEVQRKNKDVELMVKSAILNKNININEKIVVPDAEPSIGELLNVTAKVNEYSLKLINNKAILKGDIKILCVYVDAVDGKISSVNSVVPFTEILDMEGVMADDFSSSQLEARVCECNCIESAAGETRSVETKCILKVELYTFRDIKYSLIDDCYATDKLIDISTEKIKLPKRISNINYNDALKSSINIEENDPLIQQVYDVFSKAYIEKITPHKEKITISGVVDNYVLYVTQDETTPIYCVKNEIEFSQQFDCGNSVNPEGDFFVEVLNTSYALNSDKILNLRVNLKINGVIYEFEEMDVITNVIKTDKELPRETASIVVYFVQDDETLWDVAKSYFTTVEEIMSMNDLAEVNISKDMRLLIPKHKSM